jgi:hypothetical protein
VGLKFRFIHFVLFVLLQANFQVVYHPFDVFRTFIYYPQTLVRARSVIKDDNNKVPIQGPPAICSKLIKNKNGGVKYIPGGSKKLNKILLIFFLQLKVFLTLYFHLQVTGK